MAYNFRCIRDPDGECIKVRCFGSGEVCIFTNDFLLEAELSAFHDAELAAATREINEIFARVERSNRDVSRHLAVLRTPLGHFLAWAEPADVDTFYEETDGGIDGNSSAEEVRRAFKIKSKALPGER